MIINAYWLHHLWCYFSSTNFGQVVALQILFIFAWIKPTYENLFLTVKDFSFLSFLSILFPFSEFSTFRSFIYRHFLIIAFDLELLIHEGLIFIYPQLNCLLHLLSSITQVMFWVCLFGFLCHLQLCRFSYLLLFSHLW